MRVHTFMTCTVAWAGAAALAAPVTLSLIPAPSADPAAAALGQYLPGESLSVALLISSPLPFIPGIIQVDYSNSGPNGQIIDWDSEVANTYLAQCLAAVNPANYPIYAGISVLVTKGCPPYITSGGNPFISFTAIASPEPGATVLVDILGPSTPADDVGAYITSDDFSMFWDNGVPGAEPILGGTVTLTTVPEPAGLSGAAAVLLLALGHRFGRARRGLEAHGPIIQP